MANAEHLTLLKQGVEAWNRWRQNNDPTVVDLSGADLSRANLNEINLKMANLHQADLRMANLTEADLTGADLNQADLRGANLRGATLNLADLNQADLSGAHLMLINLIDANLPGVNLSEANLRIANLTRANLSEANLKMANLSGANLRDVNFRMANLADANLTMANLSGANLEATQAADANFSKSILTGTCLENWQPNRATDLSQVICDYIYLRVEQQQRYPEEGNFKAGEFAKVWRTLNTNNLIVDDHPPAVDNYPIEPYPSFPDFADVDLEISPPAPPELEPDTPSIPSFESPIPVEASMPEQNHYIPLSPQPVIVQPVLPIPPVQPLNQPPSNLPKEIQEVEDLIKLMDKQLSQPKWLEVAVEIQELLHELTQNFPSHTPLEKVIVVAAAIKQIDSKPLLKSKLINALQEGGGDDLKQYVKHPLIKILVPALEG